MSKLAKALTAAAGNAGGSLYVEDVFSTYLYEGNGTGQTITNGIDLNGKGGLVWFKSRTDTGSNVAVDTERGGDYQIYTNSDNDQDYLPSRAIGFNADGFSVSADIYNTNKSGQDYASWTFRKAEKFFDVVTYTGNGVAGRTVAHNLGSAPACMIIKRTDSVKDWTVYHSGLNGGSSPQSYSIYLNLTDSQGGFGAAIWNSTTPSDSVFTLGSSDFVNGSGGSYVAYLFASDAGGFGDDGSENIIKCGSYTGDGVSGKEIDVGFEPQWVMVKASDTGNPWAIMDIMRGANGQAARSLQPNSTSDEQTVGQYGSYAVQVTATGFKLMTDDEGGGNGNGNNYIYIAIRRPMKTPESGTEVFSPITSTGTGSAANITTNFPVDLTIVRDRNNTDDDRNFVWDRLRGNSQRLTTQNTGAEQSASHVKFDYQDKIVTAGNSTWYNTANYIFWNFKRATGFFDVVAYTGDDVSTRTVAHNLGVTPEFIIVKRRDGTGNWAVYHEGTSANPEQNYLFLNATNQVQSSIAYWNYTAPTDTHFAVRSSNDVNGIIGGKYIAYLFATLDGVSKVGSYTGNGSNQTIDCGFSAGARFVLIKGTTLSSNWVVFDSARGITVNNDPVLYLNSTIAEFTDSGIDIEPDSSGFIVNSGGNVNASGETYIFLAIA